MARGTPKRETDGKFIKEDQKVPFIREMEDSEIKLQKKFLKEQRKKK